ncbi:aspartate aminotransferase [Aureococcus anophagefferens]|nr:aspartate aminotransferase [Aureococcus anophagefferens]
MMLQRMLVAPRRAAGSARALGLFAGVEAVPQADAFPAKVNLAQGAYRTEGGEPLLLEAVREAERRVVARGASKEYLPVEGLRSFVDAAAAFALGADSPALLDGRVASLQALSGTGSLRVCAEMLRDVAGVAEAGLAVGDYAYLDATRTSLDFDAMVSDLDRLPPDSVVLLHAAAHNPSGVDPTRDQWRALADLFAEKQLVPLFDTAYQGFASGDDEADAFAVRLFEARGHAPILCQSFAKNLGLYGERVGAVHVVCGSEAEAANLLSRVKQLVVRPMYSSPPLHGASLAAEVLGDGELRERWRGELLAMAQRIVDVRAALRGELERLDAAPPGAHGWRHITDQIGMFAFTGLTAPQVRSMRAVEHVYCTENGRMSLAGLAAADVPYVAAAVKRATDAIPSEERVAVAA